MGEIKPSFHLLNDMNRAILCVGNKMTFWDLEYSYAIKEVIGHLGSISCSKTFNNETRFITGSLDQKLKIWDSIEGNHIITLKGHNHSVIALDAFYDEANRIIRVASGDTSGKIIIWVVDEDKNEFKIDSMLSLQQWINCLYFFKDGTKILSGLLDDRIMIWNVSSDENALFSDVSTPFLRFSKKSKSTTRVKVFSKENELITSSGTHLCHWKIDGTLLGTFTGHKKHINSFKLIKNGTRLISGSEDGTIRTWDVLKCSSIRVFDIASPVYSLSVSNDEKIFRVFTSDCFYRTYNIDSGELVSELDLSANKSVVRKIYNAKSKKQYNAHGVSRVENPDLVIEKLMSTIDKFVPREFRTIISSDYGYCKLGDAILKTITVLFTDIRDFTSLSENMSVKELMDFLNMYLAFAIPPIYANNGFVDKFIGDSVMSLFASDNITEQADYAVLCAIKIQKDLRFMQEAEFTSRVETGIGINTGRAIIGWVGTETRMNPTVLGDTVNLSSRMESLCKVYGSSIIISEQTKERLGRRTEMLTIRLLGEVVVKGKRRPCKIYEVVDGDREEIQEKKKNIQRSGYWDEGQMHYRNYQFERAIEAFQKCLNIYPQDKPSLLYIERCRKELLRGETFDPAEWDPIIHFEFK